ncbi:hypothetical protein [Pyxidicoccus xibeiensis]|uniref:hypothetical protein n=1 Tax=Pyxidicoccus xibeiensis TaxID=2906759 RepID=UPI0020A74E40|nr:hypothetical protein [Pyxidicoccus xibeiensis]MCP3137085.1 hypothetical protein [Pyxidicoccus xibeiensis]
MRWWFLSLPLLVSTPVLAEDGVTVRVRCTEDCTVVFDGKRGFRVNESTWEFKTVSPGQRRVEATGVLGRPLLSGFADIPDVAEAEVFLSSSKRIVVEAGSTPMPGTPGWAKAKPSPGPGSQEKSVAHVRCAEECTVLLDGRRGLRKDGRTWHFKDVEPGKRRVEAEGRVLKQRLFVGYVEIPSGSEATLYGDSKGQVTLMKHRSLDAAEKARQQDRAGEESQLNVRCQKPCTVSLDGMRRGSSNATSVVMKDLKPGPHELKVDFLLGGRMRRATLEVPASSEMFVTASEDGGLQVTNTKALSAE